TSRERLNLSSETVFSLDGLDFPDWETPEDAAGYAAVKLFLQSAHRVQPDFELTADMLPWISRICRQVRGLPLGILLAAAWLEMLAAGGMGAEIERSLDFLESDTRDLPSRQRSLRAVFEHSWALLTANEQSAFSKLAVIRGTFTREAAQSIAGTSLRTLMAL